jgi:adenosine deaminase
MVARSFIEQMPKVELHVHLEGAIRPETLLKLGQRNGVELPADDVEGLQSWYTFRDFPHFVEIYVQASKCIRTAEDIELIAKEFLDGQKAQNVLHTEATYTARTIEKYAKISFEDQLAALQSAIKYGRNELGISCQFIIDMVRDDEPEIGLKVAKWAVSGHGQGVCALGLAGIEGSRPARAFSEGIAYAKENGLPVVPHAGETRGPESIWDALEACDPTRIGHGVHAVEDRRLMDHLVDRGIVLEVCPSSNVCLGQYPTLAVHPLPELLNEGVQVTINSDDPPMFGTSLTEEFVRVSDEFHFGKDILFSLTMNAARASLLATEEKQNLIQCIRDGFNDLE